jgi:pimeloyl-ACP methyl ester carboxylesterase
VLYRPSVQPYLISWMKRVPAKAFAALTIPVLVVQGGTDIQVGTEQAQALKAAHPKATLALIPDMNHVLKLVPADAAAQARAYSDPTLPLHPALIGHLKAFLDKASR